ncbi:MAG: nuclear transport factor 2 family protein [Beijerinckiaceae bacterium]
MPAGNVTDLIALQNATQAYLDALYEGDAEKIATVFLPSSALTQVFDNELKITPRDVWLDAVRNRPSPKAQGLSRHDHILAIDLISDTLAHVKVKCAIPPRFFTDILSFVKLDGTWRVAQKVFTTEVQE